MGNLFGSPKVADDGGTTVQIFTDKARNTGVSSNYISTAQYTWYDFVPKNLFKQFKRASNCYFLLNMIIANVPGVSPIHPATALVPLVIVLVTAAAKDWWEDLQRTRDDKKWNSQTGKFHEGPNGERGRALSGIVRDGVLQGAVESKDVEVGDIIKLCRGEQIRADVLLLSSSDPEEHSAYIETMQLDGETNAKYRQAAQTQVGTGMRNLTADLVTDEAFRNVDLRVECVKPSANLHDWTGRLEYNGKQEGLNISQFLYRGSVLVNTAWAYGMVIHTGMDTKMQKNNKPKKMKFPELDRKLNYMIAALFVVQQLVIFVMCALAVVHQNREDDSWYISNYLNYNAVALFFWRYLTYFILVSFMIPISLFVTIELTKAAQAVLMAWDEKMKTYLYDANGDQIGEGKVGCTPRTYDLNEQLAIVRYIFSDKTGTLTENRMVFHTGDVGHPEHSDIRGSGAEFRMARSEDALEQELRDRGVSSPPVALDTGRSPLDTDNILWYLLNLSMCHELSILTDDEHPSPKVMYQGASPDEVALARAAQSNGVEFVARTSSSITVNILGKKCIYRILDTLPFTSKRKLMSIILQGPCVNVDGELLNTNETSRFLLTKGADSAVMSLCAGATVMERNSGGREVRTTVPGLARDRWYSEAYYERLTSELTKLGGIGLRTLVLAYKPLSDDLAYNEWHEDYVKGKKIVGTDQRDAAMEASWGAMERNFFVCGATAIEDKLQDQVPETIDHLIQAGIVVWMLTGDKQETAETIAGTARLVDKQTWQLCYVQAALPAAYAEDVSQPQAVRNVRRTMREAWLCGLSDATATTPPLFVGDNEEVLEAFKAGRSLAKGSFLMKGLEDAKRAKSIGQKSAIITDGATLSVVIPPGPEGVEEQEAKDAVEKMWKDFIELAQLVNSGVLCRLTPEQKGTIVKSFQDSTGATALAIGDGSNDVPMINESYVGIGIMGLEGSQAVLASDYAIPRFKHLRRLMFVHGRYALYRNSMCIMFSFYKNFTLSLLQIYFSFACAFSGQTLFDSWLLAFQNFAFTSIPPLLVGIFERDVAEDVAEDKALLYPELREGLYFDKKTFVVWFGGAVFHSAMLYGLTYSTQANDDMGGKNGRTIDLLSHGTLVLTCQICTVLAKLAIHIRCWTWIQAVGLGISLLFYLLFLVTYSSIHILFGDASFHGSAFYVLGDPKYWIWTAFFVAGLVGVLDLSLMYFQKQYRPSKRDIAAHLHHKQRAVAAHTEDVRERRRSKLSGGGGSTRASVDNVLRPPGSNDDI